MYKQISFVASLFVVAACGMQEQPKSPSDNVAPITMGERMQSLIQTSSSTTYTPQAPAPTRHADLPAECSVNPVAVVKEDLTLFQCSCRGATTEARWSSVKSKDPSVKNDCLTGLYYDFQVMRLPIRGPRAVDILAGTAASSVNQATSAAPVAQASASALPPAPVAPGTVASVGNTSPLPAPSASAPAAPTAPAEVVKSTRVDTENGLKITYQCEEGKVAKRMLQKKGDKTPTEIQTCGGEDKVVCLTGLDKQTDLTIPPCTCKSGQAPRKTIGAWWTCD